MKKETLAIGLMSGSSLDGLDIALVRFEEENEHYRFQILQAETLPYPTEWKTFAKVEDLCQYIESHPIEGKTILVKGSHSVQLEKVLRLL